MQSRYKTTAENYSSARQKMCHDVKYDFLAIRQSIRSSKRYIITHLPRKMCCVKYISGRRRDDIMQVATKNNSGKLESFVCAEKMCHDVTYDFLAIRLATLNCSTLLQALARVLLFSGLSLTFSNHLSRTENILSLGDRGGWRWLISVHTCVLW